MKPLVGPAGNFFVSLVLCGFVFGLHSADNVTSVLSTGGDICYQSFCPDERSGRFPVPTHRKSRRHLLPFQSVTTTHAFVLHSGLLAAIELADYWRRFELLFIIDSHFEVQSDRIHTFLSLGSFEKFEVVTISGQTSLTALLSAQTDSIKNLVLLCSEENTDRLLTAADSLQLFSEKHNWMIVSNGFPTSLLEIHMTPDSQIVLFVPDRNESLRDISDVALVEIFDLFYSPLLGRMKWLQFGEWHFRRRLFIYEDFLPEDQLYRLHGRPLKTMAFNHLPYCRVSNKDGVVKGVSGFSGDVHQALFNYMSGSLITSEIEFGWGGAKINGSYEGLVGRMYRKECEITYNVMHKTAQRKEAVRFVGTLSRSQLDLIYATPPSTIPPTTYVLPFDVMVWAMTFVTCLCVIFLLGVTAIFSPVLPYALSYFANPAPPTAAPTLTPAADSGNIVVPEVPPPPPPPPPPSSRAPLSSRYSMRFHILTGSFFVEALDDPTGTTARIFYASLMVAVLMLFTYYNSLLTSFLSYQQKQVPIRSLQDLADKKEFYPLFLNRSSQLQILKAAAGGEFAAVWRRAHRCGRPCMAASPMEFARMFRRRKYVFLSDSTSVMAYIDICSNTVIGTGNLKDMYYVTTRMDFPYSRIMYKSLLRLHEGGVVKRFKSRYLQDSKEICTTEMSISSFGFEQTVGLFVVLAIGMMMAFVTNFGEVMYHRHHHRRTLKNKAAKENPPSNTL